MCAPVAPRANSVRGATRGKGSVAQTVDRDDDRTGIGAGAGPKAGDRVALAPLSDATLRLLPVRRGGVN